MGKEVGFRKVGQLKNKSVPAFVRLSFYCDMEPSLVKVGELGAQEKYLFVCGPSGQDGRCFNLGEGVDEQAKNRYSMAMAAVVSGLSLQIQYWDGGVASCDEAIANLVVPNTMRLKK